MKKIASTLVLLAVLLTPLGNVSAFSDVPETHQYYAAIESLKNLGIVSGYDDGTFKPSNTVNRAEALKMILGSAGIEVPEYDGSSSIGFTDVAPSQWFTKFLIVGKNRGIVKGNDDGTFAPAREVIKAEFIKMVLESFGTDLSHHQNPSSDLALDVKKTDWFAPYLSYAKTVGLTSPTLDNKLIPGKSLTRGECAEIIYRMLLIQNGGDAQKMLSIAESNLVDVLVYLNANDVSNAIKKADNAVFYTEKAMEAAPDENVAEGANKIAQSFRNLCLAYQAGVKENNEEVRTYVDSAKSLAAEAEALGASSALKSKVEEIGNVLLDQID